MLIYATWGKMGGKCEEQLQDSLKIGKYSGGCEAYLIFSKLCKKQASYMIEDKFSVRSMYMCGYVDIHI